MFTIHKTDTGAVVPWEYLPAAAGEYKAGQMVKGNGLGTIVSIDADTAERPGYLCMANITVAEAGELIPVTRVVEGVIYETTTVAANISTGVGRKVKVAAGGLGVKIDSDDGCFELVSPNGPATGDTVFGRFV